MGADGGGRDGRDGCTQLAVLRPWPPPGHLSATHGCGLLEGAARGRSSTVGPRVGRWAEVPPSRWGTACHPAQLQRGTAVLS